jgi:hypothetical protein
MPIESDNRSVPKSESGDARAAAGVASGSARAALRYVDRPDCNETFADSISRLSFDGQTLRIEFAVSRIDETKPDTQVTGRLYPACRLVLTPAAAADLMQKMQQVAAALMQARLQKQGQSQPVQESNGADKTARKAP